MTTLLLATRNRHKAQEIQSILGPAFRCLTLDAFPGAPVVVEDAPTFEGNASKKALALAEWLSTFPIADCRLPIEGHAFVLADDSGLEVDALGGAPGVHSARFAALDGAVPGGGNSPDAANNAKLLRLLADVPAARRSARFRCVLALVEINRQSVPRSGSNRQFFFGVCEGRINFGACGAGGFGYDPLFVPEGFAQTFAELGDDAKNAISHRSRALASLREWFSAGASSSYSSSQS